MTVFVAVHERIVRLIYNPIEGLTTWLTGRMDGGSARN